MQLSDLLCGVEHEILRECGAEGITQITHDTRGIETGAMFICLRGGVHDGHDFIAQAIEKGAVAVLVDEEFNGELPAVGVVKVKNTREAMAYIAANFHGKPAQRLRLVGVTGTNGKTTTTYFIDELLRACGRKTGLIGTVGVRANGQPMKFPFKTDTTPDPVELHGIFAKMESMGITDVVMEVSSHALALYKMAGLTFDVGVFTNLTQDHLDFHGTMENYAKAKAKLFAQSRFSVVNADDEYTPIMLEARSGPLFATYGIENAASFRALNAVHNSGGSSFGLNGLPVRLPVVGKFNVYNALAAIGTVRAMGEELEKICAAAMNLQGVPGRIQSVPNQQGMSVFVDYAHTPDGLEKIIHTVRESTDGRVITLFGCGGDRDKTKRPIMGEIAARLSDYIFLTSDNPRTEDPYEILAQIEEGIKTTATPYEKIENRRMAIFAAIKTLTTKDALIIAGKGHEDYQIIGTVKHWFDDFKVALEALQN